MVPLIATQAFTYAHRRLKADDPFDARSKADARVLIAIGKAKLPSVGAAESAAPSITDLRKQYQAVIGRRPAMTWGAAMLLEKIAAANQAKG